MFYIFDDTFPLRRVTGGQSGALAQFTSQPSYILCVYKTEIGEQGLLLCVLYVVDIIAVSLHPLWR